ncbi:MAG: glycosyltransferase family 4 protein [Agathobacter sp.]|nr:glycosyltransferase family 4 protein [Agathobacter sp.]
MYKKIIITCVTYYPDVNGVQFVTQNLAEGLVRKGYEVTVVTEKKANREKNERKNGVNIVRIDMHNYHMWHYGNRKEYNRTILQLSNKADAIIFVNLQSVAADWAVDILDKIKCQKILYQHGIHSFEWEKIDMQSIKNMALKFIRNIRWKEFYLRNKKKFCMFDKIIHLHGKDYSYQFFEQICNGKNFVLENFAEDIFFEIKNDIVDIKEKYAIANCKYMIYVSNYCTRKNQELLLKVFNELNVELNLIMIGANENQYLEKLKKKVRKEGVYLLTNVERKDIATILQNAMFFVMPSKWERYPIVLTECMAAGIPYISSDVGIVKHLPGGMVVNPDKESFIDAIKTMFYDKQLYGQKRKEVMEYAMEHYKFEKYLESFIKILEK